MKIDRISLVIMLIFALIALAVTREAITADGYLKYRDEVPLFSNGSLSEYFLHIVKNNNVPDLDFTKRVPFFWTALLVPDGLFDRFKLMVPVFLTLAISYFVAGRMLDDSKLSKIQKASISFAGSLIYLITPISTQLFISFFPMVNYALFPLFFYFLYEGFSRPSGRYILFSSLVASYMALMVVHSVLYVGITFIALIPLLIRKKLPLPTIAHHAALFSAVFLFSTLFVSLPYLSIFPIEKTPGGLFRPTDSDLMMFSSVAELPRAMLGDFHAFWWPYVDYKYPMENIFFPLAMIFTAALLLHAIFERSSWSICALIALSILFFFSKGISGPFPDIYEFITFNIPLGWLLRVPTKFLHIIPFFLFILFLRLSLTLLKFNRYACGAFILLYLSFLCVFSWPFFTGDAAGTLEKTDFSSRLADISEVNAIIGDDRPGIIAYGPVEPVMLKTDLLWGNRDFSNELSNYSQFSDWSGLSAFSGLGYQYIIVPPNERRSLSKEFTEVFRGKTLSLFRLKDDPSIFSASSSGHLCYCGSLTARSIVRDPPGGEPAPILLAPYEYAAFPAGHVSAATHVVMDSSPPVFPFLGNNMTFSFRGESGAWTYKNESLADKEENFGPNFRTDFTYADTGAAPGKNKTAEPAFSLEDLLLEPHDPLTSHDGNGTFALLPGSPLSIVTADLPLEAGSEYNLSLSMESSSAGNLSAYIVLRDGSGEVFSAISLSSGEPDFSLEKRILVPPKTASAKLQVSASGNSENVSYFSIRSLNASRLVQKSGSKIATSFNVTSTGDYDIYLRIFKGASGGRLGFYLDGKKVGEISTKNATNHLSWERIYRGPLENGTHKVAAEQLGGFNAVSVGKAVPSGYTADYLAGKTIIYRLSGRNSFSGYLSSITANSSSSTFFYRKSRQPLQSMLHVLSGGTYNISHAISGKAYLNIDGKLAGQSVYLEKGTHLIEIVPQNSTIYVDHVTLTRHAAPPKHDPIIINYTRHDPSTYSIWVNSSAPFYLSFGRTASSGWITEVNGKKYLPAASYSLVNAYLINESGLNRIEISYYPQKMLFIGGTIGIAGLLVCIAYTFRTQK
jgi:hypothetical protein